MLQLIIQKTHPETCLNPMKEGTEFRFRGLFEPEALRSLYAQYLRALQKVAYPKYQLSNEGGGDTNTIFHK